MAFANLQIALSANTAHFNRGMKKASKDAKKTSDAISKNFQSSSKLVTAAMASVSQQVDRYRQKMDGYFKAATVATAAAGAAAAAFGSVAKLVDVQREFDKLNASLITVAGSSANAAAAMDDLKNFAKETPFGLAQAVDGFVKLKALGLTPSTQALTSFGNTASAMGKDLNQMIEAVADASTFEFERLKEFGIKARQEKDRVAFTFQGVTTEVAKNSAAIEQYLTNIGNVQFAGAMQQRMNTLDGAISSLGDSWNELLLTIGNYKVFDTSLMDAMAAAAKAAGDALDWLGEHLNIVVGVAGIALASLAANMIGTATSTATAWAASSAAKVRANIAEAASMQSQIALINAYHKKMAVLRLTKTYYIATVKDATKAVLGYVAVLPKKISGIKAATVAMLQNTRATLTMTNAKKALTATVALTARGMASLGGVFGSVGRIIMAHPLMLIGGIIATIIVRTMGLKKAMESLSDAFSVAGELLGRFIDWGIDGFGNLLDSAGSFLDRFLGQSKSTTGGVSGYFSEMFAGTRGGFVGLMQVAASSFDRMTGFAAGCAKYMLDHLNRFKNQAINLFINIGNAIGTIFSSRINATIDAINWVNGKLGGDADYIPHFNFTPSSTIQVADVHFDATGGTNLRSMVDDAIGVALANKKNQGGSGYGGATAGGGNASGKGGKSGKGKNQSHKQEKTEAQKLAEKIAEDIAEATAKVAKLRYEATQAVNNAYTDMLFETQNEFGKFYKATKEQKQALTALAKDEDLYNAKKQANIEFVNLAKNLHLIGKENPFDVLLYDLYDVRNELSLLNEETKQTWLLLEAKNQSSQVAYDLNEKIKDLHNDAALQNETSEYRREILQIEQAITKELEKYKGLNQGNAKEIYDQIVANHQLYAQEQKKLATQKAYLQIKSDNQSKEEKQLNTLNNQLLVLKAQTDELRKQGQDADDIVMLSKKLLDNVIGLPKAQNPYGDLADEAAGRHDALDKWSEQMLADEQLTEEQRVEIKRWGAAKREEIEKNYQDSVNRMILTDSENMFGSLASIAKDGLGEQSKAYRAMFAIEKGFAIARSIMAIQTALANASASGPFPANLGMMATVASQVASIVSNIKSVVMPVGQAHDGIMSVPKSGTWNLEKGERVLPRHTAKALDDKLDKIGNGGNHITVNQHFVINSDGTSTDDKDSQSLLGNAFDNVMRAFLIRECRQNGIIDRAIRQGA